MWVPTPALVESVVERFGTPTFVYDGGFAERNFDNLRRKVHEGVDVFYSLKANPNVSVTKEICARGAGAEVSSLAELRTALRAGVDPRNIIFVGPAKTIEELEACIDRGIFAIVCESVDEMKEVDALVAQRVGSGARAPVMIRVNPEFSGAGSGLAMSGKPRQFGIDERVIRASAEEIKSLRAIDVLGFHIYMGTRYLDAAAVVKNTQNILAVASSLAEELNIPLRAVDVGGGFGVPYFKNETPLDLESLTAGINEAVRQFRDVHRDARIILELGRFLAAGCGVLLTKVRYVKESMGEIFAIADGGTNVHMAAVGLGSFAKRNFPVVNFTSTCESELTYTVTGPLCTPNDTLAKRVSLRKVGKNDILGVLYSGAYGPSASPTYFLSHGYPAEVLVKDGEARLVRKRETVDDLLRNQILIKNTVKMESVI